MRMDEDLNLLFSMLAQPLPPTLAPRTCPSAVPLLHWGSVTPHFSTQGRKSLSSTCQAHLHLLSSLSFAPFAWLCSGFSSSRQSPEGSPQLLLHAMLRGTCLRFLHLGSPRAGFENKNLSSCKLCSPRKLHSGQIPS